MTPAQPIRSRLKRWGIRVVGLSAVAAVSVVVLAQPSTRPSRAAGGRQTTTRLFSDVKGYASLQQLRQDAAAVAVVKPTTTTRIENVQGVPFTLTTVTVVEMISGPALPNSFALRQTGVSTDPRLPLVSSTKMYLAYLQPFELQPGVPIAGQYVVIGNLQGLFEQASGQAAPTPAGANATRFTRVDPEATALPSTVTVQDAANG